MNNTLRKFTLAIFTIVLIAFVSSCGKKEDVATDGIKGATETTIKTVQTEVSETAEQAEALTSEKFDQKLIEFIKNIDTDGAVQMFTVDAILSGNYTESMVSQLEAKGADVIFGEKNKLRMQITSKELEDIKDLNFITNFVLITKK